MQSQSTQIKTKILDFLTLKGKPRSSEQIARGINLPVASVAPRVSELVRSGKLFDSGLRGQGGSGRPVTLFWSEATYTPPGA